MQAKILSSVTISALMLSLLATASASNLEIISPSSRTYGTGSIDFNLTNATSGVNLTDANFTVDSGSNTTMKQSGDYFYNTSYPVISSGRHNATFYGKNESGDIYSSTVDFTVDTVTPNLTAYQPAGGKNISGNFSINATWSDNLEIESANYSINDSSDTEGSLNDTLDSSTLSDGTYELTFNATDGANNSNTSSVEIQVDNSAPSLAVKSPSNQSYQDETFEVKAYWSDFIGVETAQYNITNSSGEQKTGSLNSSVNLSSLEEGDYNISFSVTDYLNHSTMKEIGFTLDSTRPDIDPKYPSSGANLTGEVYLNASRSDSGGIEASNYSIGSLTGPINSTVNTTNLSDGDYTLEFNATDKAGNTNSTSIQVSVDNEPPSVDFSVDDVVTGNLSVSGSASDAGTAVKLQDYRIESSSQNYSWTNVSQEYNTSDLSEGEYNISFRVKDYSGNWRNTSDSFTLDTTDPSITVTVEGPDTWSDQKWVSIECSDATDTEAAVLIDSEVIAGYSSAPANFTVDESEPGNFTLRCRDGADRTADKTRELMIDSEAPELRSSEPEDGEGGMELEFGLEVNFSEQISGFDTGASSVSLENGELENVEWDNDEMSLEADVAGLEFDTYYTIELRLADNAGNKRNLEIDFSTREPTPREKRTFEKKRNLKHGISEIGIENRKKREILVARYRKSDLLEKMSLKLAGKVERGSVLVEESDTPEKAEPAPGSIYSYLRIETVNIPGFSSANLTLRVEKSWLEKKNRSVKDLFVKHYNGTAWRTEQFTMSEKDKSIVIEVTPESFSSFAVGLEPRKSGSFLPDFEIGQGTITTLLLLGVMASFLYTLNALGFLDEVMRYLPRSHI